MLSINAWSLLLVILLALGPGCKAKLTLEIYALNTNLELDFGKSNSREISLPSSTDCEIWCSKESSDGIFPQYPWTHNSVEVTAGPTDGAIVYYENADSNRKLHISNFSSSLAGNYSCHTANYTKTLIITEDSVSIVLDKKYEEQSSGNSASFYIKFILLSNPTLLSLGGTVTYDWTLEGEPIVNGTNIHKIGNSFVITFDEGIKRENSGVYTLTVTTEIKTITTEFKLQVFTRPSLEFSSDCNCLKTINNDATVVVNIGDSFSIYCNDNSSIPVPAFFWFKHSLNDNNIVVISDEHINTTLVTPRQSALMFNNISIEHGGEYLCKANNSKHKEEKTVTVNIRHSPQITAISPFIIDIPVNDKISILIQYNGGYPTPSANWTHYDGIVNTSVSNNNRAYRNGLYLLNLTITNCTEDDGGLYTLTVDNGVGDIAKLQFTINILVPPSLFHFSNLTNHRPVGGMVEFVVGMSIAQPPVTADDIIWSGNFSKARQIVEYKNNEAVLFLSDLVIYDTGNITMTIMHLAETVTIQFELIVLNVPATPDNINIISIGTCHKRLTWVIGVPAPMIAPISEVLLEYRPCLYNDSTCTNDWEVLAIHSPEVTSCDIILLPNQEYSYSVISCSDDYGCSESNIIEIAVDSNVQGFNPKVTFLHVTPVDSSSILISWSEPQQQTDCYNISNYTITCQNTRQKHKSYTRQVPNDQSNDYSITLTGLEPDSEYNCSIGIKYMDRFASVVNDINTSPAYSINYTYPRMPSVQRFDIVIDNNGLMGTATVNLKAFKDTFTEDDTSYIHVVVLRLGNSPTLPSQTPDQKFPNMDEFSTYELVHSESGRLSYKPYIAAEIAVEDLPDTFTIGSESLRKREGTYSNGPLDESDYYTVFIRAYANSQFGRQSSIFLSSSFTPPFESGSGVGTTEAAGSNSGAVAGVIVVLIIIAVCLAIAIAIVVLVVYRRRGQKQRLSLSSQIVDTNGDMGMNQYSDLSEVKGRSESPPPQLPSSGPPKKKPLTATNPTFDTESSSLPPEESDSKSVSLKITTGDSSPSTSSRLNTPHPTSPASIGGKKSPSQPILRDEFQNHLDYLDDNGQVLFAKEFMSIQSYSREHQAEASVRAGSSGKNRYKNITAFDYTRVELSEVDNIPNSDYINANYIKGYDEHKLYIATQGPTEDTHVDFWRMIWEQRTTTIVMLTNLEEKGKPKCFKYWPSQGGKAYGNIVVRVDRDIVLPYYVIRSFKLIDASFSDRERTVIQFHYTAWPDKNVPAQASPVLDFLRAINSANDPNKHGPIVVHCSAGVGRTGTIIALDICLDMLKTEGRVDVKSVVSFLREQRTQMVQTQSQYIFIHHAILEDIVYGDSTVLLKHYPEKYLKLQASHCALIKAEYDKIGLVRPPAQANPGPSILKIQTEDGGEASLPAFVIDGYWYQRLFIASASPSSPDNEEMFWHLVWHEGCSHIINISPKSHGLASYLPDSGKQKKFGELEITVERMEYKTGYILRTITIAAEQCKETLSVKHMQYEDWLSNQLPRTDKFVKFLQECMRETCTVERQGKPILIHDNGGMSQVGIFIALLNCCDRIQKERLVDLLQSVNHINLQCPSMINSMELNLYAYCYDCLHEYCGKLLRETSEPPIYENIASIRGRLQSSPEPVQESPKFLNDYDILDESILDTVITTVKK